METDEHRLREQLRAADRGEAAAWLSWEPRFWQHTAFFTAWTVVFALNAGLAGGAGSATVNLLLTVAALGFLWAERRRAGTYPDGAMPRELRRPVAWSMALFVGVVLVTWALASTTPWWLLAPLAGVATFVAMWAYSRTYAAACVRVRSRLEVAS